MHNGFSYATLPNKDVVWKKVVKINNREGVFTYCHVLQNKARIFFQRNKSVYMFIRQARVIGEK